MANNSILKTRRLFLLSSGISITAFVSGCLTSNLYKNKTYFERISSILVSHDKTKVVVIGQNYHYLFDATNAILQTIGASFHRKIRGEFGLFHVTDTGKIRGDYTLILSQDATDQEKTQARAAGYTNNQFGSLQYKGRLTGHRYPSAGVEAQLTSQRLNKTYLIQVVVEKSTGELIANTMVSPITLTADGLLVLASLPLLVLFGAACTYKEDGCK